MKKNDFDNRLQNDLFPEMPISFGRKLTKAMEDEGVKVKLSIKRINAKGATEFFNTDIISAYATL